MTSHTLAYDLEVFFEKQLDSRFETNEYYNLVATFDACGSTRNKHKTFEFFKTIPRSDVIFRSNTVAKLYSILKNIGHNATSNT